MSDVRPDAPDWLRAEQEAQRRPRYESLRMPATVTWALGIMWVCLAIALVFVCIAVGSISALASSGPEGIVVATMTIVAVSLVVMGLEALALVFTAKGRQWARVLLTVLVGASIVLSWVSGDGLTFGDALSVVVIVLLFLPPSNAWFAAHS